jgi:hypothetical protein
MSTERAGIVEAGVKLGSAVVHSLGPAFLALLLVNALVLGLLFWFIDARAQHTVTIVNQLLAACLQRAAG